MSAPNYLERGQGTLNVIQKSINEKDYAKIATLGPAVSKVSEYITACNKQIDEQNVLIFEMQKKIEGLSRNMDATCKKSSVDLDQIKNDLAKCNNNTNGLRILISQIADYISDMSTVLIQTIPNKPPPKPATGGIFGGKKKKTVKKATKRKPKKKC